MRRILCSLVVILCSHIARPALAEFLIAELYNEESPFDRAAMTAELWTWDGQVQTKWTQSFQYGDTLPVGQTFAAPPATVDAFEACLYQPSCQVSVISGSEAFRLDFTAGHTWDYATYDPRPGLTVTTFVPPLGPAFAGYDITNITRTFDAISMVWDGRYYVNFLAQTMRIYGEGVPEPASLLLAGITVLPAAGWRRSRRSNELRRGN